MKKDKQGFTFPLIAVVLLLIVAAAIAAALVYVLGSRELSLPGQSSAGVRVPEKVSYTKSDVYTTYYGTFDAIESVLKKNEYMTLHPSYLDEQESLYYITCTDEGDRDAVLEEISSLSARICGSIDTERGKAYAMAMWVGENVAYDYDAAAYDGSGREVISLEAIIENDYRTTCGGFANLYAALCSSQGIYCLNMKGGCAGDGYSRSELEDIPSNHEWNAVVIDGEWLYSDCTWISDRSYENGEFAESAVTRPFYALIGFGEMSVEHRADRCEHRTFTFAE